MMVGKGWIRAGPKAASGILRSQQRRSPSFVANNVGSSRNHNSQSLRALYLYLLHGTLSVIPILFSSVSCLLIFKSKLLALSVFLGSAVYVYAHGLLDEWNEPSPRVRRVGFIQGTKFTRAPRPLSLRRQRENMAASRQTTQEHIIRLIDSKTGSKTLPWSSSCLDQNRTTTAVDLDLRSMRVRLTRASSMKTMTTNSRPIKSNTTMRANSPILSPVENCRSSLVKTTTTKKHPSGSNSVVFRNDDEGSKENRLGTDNNHSSSRSTSLAAVAAESRDDNTSLLILQKIHPGDYDEEECNDDIDNAGWERKKDNDGRVVEQPGLGPPSSAPRSTSPAAVTDESRDDNISLSTLQKIHPGDYDEEESNDDNDNAGWERKKDNDGRVVDVDVDVDVDVEQPDLGPPSFASRSTSPSAVTDESRDDNISLLTLQKSHPGGYDEEESNDDIANAGWEQKKDNDGQVVDIDVEQPGLGPPPSAWINDECGNHPEETTPLVMEALASFSTTTCGMLSERIEI
jgi:predicted HTH domain antitoxin